MRHGTRTGFSLIEVIVSLTIFSIGVVGITSVFSLCSKTGGDMARLNGAVNVAQVELARAVAAQDPYVLATTGTEDIYKWIRKVSDAGSGLLKAEIEVTWQVRGNATSFEMDRIFRLRQAASQ